MYKALSLLSRLNDSAALTHDENRQRLRRASQSGYMATPSVSLPKQRRSAYATRCRLMLILWRADRRRVAPETFAGGVLGAHAYGAGAGTADTVLVLIAVADVAVDRQVGARVVPRASAGVAGNRVGVRHVVGGPLRRPIPRNLRLAPLWVTLMLLTISHIGGGAHGELIQPPGPLALRAPPPCCRRGCR